MSVQFIYRTKLIHIVVGHLHDKLALTVHLYTRKKKLYMQDAPPLKNHYSNLSIDPKYFRLIIIKRTHY